jgi:hypothetical protein
MTEGLPEGIMRLGFAHAFTERSAVTLDLAEVSA